MLSFQIFMTSIYLYLLIQVIHDIYEVIKHGRPGLIFPTFFYALFLDQLKAILAKGESIAFLGFGKFEVSERAARDGRNPQTGEKLKIAGAFYADCLTTDPIHIALWK